MKKNANWLICLCLAFTVAFVVVVGCMKEVRKPEEVPKVEAPTVAPEKKAPVEAEKDSELMKKIMERLRAQINDAALSNKIFITASGKAPARIAKGVMEEVKTGVPVEEAGFLKASDSNRKLKPANISFNSPETMNLGEEKTIQLLLSEKKTIAELIDMIKKNGKKEGYTINITRVMYAALKGQEEDFTITPIKEAEQAISVDSPTEWEWTIKAKSPGTHKINLTLYRKVVVNGKERFEGIYDPAFSKDITVKVTPGQKICIFIEKNKSWLQWLWTAILVPLVGWLWMRWRRKKK